MALHPFCGAGPCPRLRLGHLSPNLSIVRRLMRLTQWFCPHILAFCRCHTLVAPRILWFRVSIASAICGGPHRNCALRELTRRRQRRPIAAIPRKHMREVITYSGLPSPPPPPHVCPLSPAPPLR